MRVKNILRILLSLVLVFGFSSAWAKTIKWSMQGDSLTLDPHAQNEGPTTQVSRQVYEALVQRGLDMKIGPALATKWKAVDPNTWYFFLREDVKFSNGQDMTSEDVVFSILRAKQPTSDFKEYISTISGVKAIDTYTVQIKTSKPNPILLNQLSNIFIMSKKWSEENFAMTTPTENLHNDMKKDYIIEQIKLLAEQLGSEVTGLTCYDSKNQWKKLTIEYDREAKS